MRSAEQVAEAEAEYERRMEEQRQQMKLSSTESQPNTSGSDEPARYGAGKRIVVNDPSWDATILAGVAAVRSTEKCHMNSDTAYSADDVSIRRSNPLSTLRVPGSSFGIASGIKKMEKATSAADARQWSIFCCLYPESNCRSPGCSGRAAVEPVLYAVIVNSGNANAATGDLGYKNACEMVTQVSEKLGVHTRQVQVCSTGVIGQRLPMPVREGIEKAFEVKNEDSLEMFAEAIRTTDLYPKVVSRTWQTQDGTYRVVGAKGAGMIVTNMATMLAFVFTDAPVDRNLSQKFGPIICQQPIVWSSMVIRAPMIPRSFQLVHPNLQ